MINPIELPVLYRGNTIYSPVWQEIKRSIRDSDLTTEYADFYRIDAMSEYKWFRDCSIVFSGGIQFVVPLHKDELRKLIRDWRNPQIVDWGSVR
jgi:hypothetical protein